MQLMPCARGLTMLRADAGGRGGGGEAGDPAGAWALPARRLIAVPAEVAALAVRTAESSSMGSAAAPPPPPSTRASRAAMPEEGEGAKAGGASWSRRRAAAAAGARVSCEAQEAGRNATHSTAASAAADRATAVIWDGHGGWRRRRDRRWNGGAGVCENPVVLRVGVLRGFARVHVPLGLETGRTKVSITRPQ